MTETNGGKRSAERAREWLYGKLACPACRGELEFEEPEVCTLRCRRCDKEYGWMGHIPVLLDSDSSDPGIERLSTVWNNAAPIWSSLIQKPESVFHAAEKPILDSLSGDILEIGCGDGRLFPEYERRELRVIGLDFAPAMLQRAVPFGFPLLLADAHHIPLREASLDGIIVPFSTIRYMDYDLFFGQAARVLRTGGILGFTAWNNWYNIRYRSRETTDWRSGRDVGSLRELFEPLDRTGFRVLSAFGVFSVPPRVPFLKHLCIRLPGTTGARLSRDIVVIAQRTNDP